MKKKLKQENYGHNCEHFFFLIFQESNENWNSVAKKEIEIFYFHWLVELIEAMHGIQKWTNNSNWWRW